MSMTELPLQSWDDVRYFLHVVEQGSLNAAAARLGIAHTTVGRRVRAMEARYGAELFVRRGNSMEITQDGNLVLDEAKAMGAAAEAFARRLGGAVGRAEGEVRIGGAEGICNYWLMPNLHPFLKNRPKLCINWILANRYGIALGKDFDIGLGWNSLKDPGAVMSRLGACGFSMFASQAYIDAYGIPKSTADFPRHRFLQFNGYEDNPGLRHWNSLMRKHGNAMRLENTSACFAAMGAGEVIALLPDYATQIDRRFVKLPLDLGIVLEVFLGYHESQRDSARIRVLVDEIKRLFAAARGTWFI